MTTTPRSYETAADRTDRTAAEIAKDWNTNPRWNGVERPYTPQHVAQLRGRITEEHTLALNGARKFWNLLHTHSYIPALGAITGNQAVEMAKAGLRAIYLSGWQVAADGNTAAATYPDQSLYPYDSVPKMVRRINNALIRADQIDYSEGNTATDYLLPIMADAEAGFGGPLNAFELCKAMISVPAPPPSTTKINSPPKRNAATSEEKSSSPPANTSATSSPPASLLTSKTSPPSSSPAPTPSAPNSSPLMLTNETAPTSPENAPPKATTTPSPAQNPSSPDSSPSPPTLTSSGWKPTNPTSTSPDASPTP